MAVFCGSRLGTEPRFAVVAAAFGRAAARRGVGVVYGGASVGLMGVVADAALAEGGEVIGVLPRGLAVRELQHRGLSDLRITDSMHERKAVMAELSDAFVALPGGLGTLDELAEAMTWTALGIHRKPCGLLDVAGFWAPLRATMRGFVDAGFMDAEDLHRLVVADDPHGMLDALDAVTIPPGVWGVRDIPRP